MPNGMQEFTSADVQPCSDTRFKADLRKLPLLYYTRNEGENMLVMNHAGRHTPYLKEDFLA
jgi:hypothetical protein